MGIGLWPCLLRGRFGAAVTLAAGTGTHARTLGGDLIFWRDTSVSAAVLARVDLSTWLAAEGAFGLGLHVTRTAFVYVVPGFRKEEQIESALSADLGVVLEVRVGARTWIGPRGNARACERRRALHLRK